VSSRGRIFAARWLYVSPLGGSAFCEHITCQSDGFTSIAFESSFSLLSQLRLRLSIALLHCFLGFQLSSHKLDLTFAPLVTFGHRHFALPLLNSISLLLLFASVPVCYSLPTYTKNYKQTKLKLRLQEKQTLIKPEQLITTN